MIVTGHIELISELLDTSIGTVLQNDEDVWRLTHMSGSAEKSINYRFETKTVTVNISTSIGGGVRYSFKPKENNA